MKNKTKEGLISAGVIIFLIFLLGLYYGWFFPPQPSVILHLAPNKTEIKGFVYAKYPGSMQCIACVNFFGEVKVFYNQTLICDSSDSLISIGEVNIPIRCSKDLAKYEGKEVTVDATGKVTPAGGSMIESYDNKSLILNFTK